MNSLSTITEILGWCTVINFGLLALAAIGLMSMRRLIAPLHARMFKISEDDLSRYYFQYLGNYKLLVIVLNLVPYLALKIVA
jgi:hypothetical protein